MVKILDGKSLSETKLNNLKKVISEKHLDLKLSVILVGENPASEIYVRNKARVAKDIGVNVDLHRFDEFTKEEELLSLINKLNADEAVNGILVQLPLPKHLSEDKIINAVDYRKDVDGFTIENSGRLMQGKDGLVSCTPAGIIAMLDDINFKYTGKHAVVIGRSQIVGLPMSKLLLDKDCTVTITHSKTKNLKEICLQADLLIVAIGQPEFIDRSYIKKGATIIDVGINRLVNKKVVGDVNFDDVKEVAETITPVPGGVGPMTIAMLMENLVKTKG